MGAGGAGRRGRRNEMPPPPKNPPALYLQRYSHLLQSEGGKGVFIDSQTRPLHANEENQMTRKGPSP